MAESVLGPAPYGYGATLAQYRQYVARELGAFWAGTATGGPTSNTTAWALQDASWPITSRLDQADLWTDAWVLRPQAALASDRVRIVQAYQPTTGTLQVDAAWTNAPSQGEPYELHTVVEPATALLDALNEGLKRCFANVEVVLATVPQAQRHSLAAFPWLRDPLWVRQVAWLATNESRDIVDPYRRVLRGACVQDGNTLWLVHPGAAFTSNETLFLRCYRRAYDLCAPGTGAPGAQSGLVLDTDVSLPSVEWAGAAALLEVWRRYGNLLETTARARLGPTRQEWAARFTDLSAQHFQGVAQTFRPLYMGGPLQGSRGTLLLRE